MRINKEEAIGLIIDIQEKLFPVMDEKEQLLENCKRLLAGWQELGIETMVTQQYTKGLGATLPEISGLLDGFNPIEKTAFSCFGEASFVEQLEASGKKTVLICGIEAHVCVLQTVVDLKDAGYNPIVIFDCVSSRKNTDKQLALERYRHEGIMVCSYESLLFELTGGARNPAFKAISKLVK